MYWLKKSGKSDSPGQTLPLYRLPLLGDLRKIFKFNPSFNDKSFSYFVPTATSIIGMI